MDSPRVGSGTELGSMVTEYWPATRVEIEARTSRMVDSMLIDERWQADRLRTSESHQQKAKLQMKSKIEKE